MERANDWSKQGQMEIAEVTVAWPILPACAHFQTRLLLFFVDSSLQQSFCTSALFLHCLTQTKINTGNNRFIREKNEIRVK